MPPNTMPSLGAQGVDSAAIPQPTSAPVAPGGASGSGTVAPTPPKSHHKLCEKCGKRLPSKAVACPACGRSEERRVGKECRSGWSPDDDQRRMIARLVEVG